MQNVCCKMNLPGFPQKSAWAYCGIKRNVSMMVKHLEHYQGNIFLLDKRIVIAHIPYPFLFLISARVTNKIISNHKVLCSCFSKHQYRVH